MALTTEQKTIVTSTVPLLESHGLEVTKTFYHNLLTDYPSLKDLFSLSAQITDHQAKALAGAVHAYAANINDLTPILPVMDRINHKHASLNITAAQYAIVGEYLLKALRQVLGTDIFTPTVEEAWGAAYWQLAKLMITREEEIMTNQEAEVGGWRGWRQMRLARKVQESSEITSFYWTPVDGGALPTYKPGQYVSIRVDTPDRKQIRQYSLSAAPIKATSIVPTDSNGVHANGVNTNNTLTNGNAATESIVHGANDLPTQYFRNSIKRESGEHPGLVSNILHNNIQEGDIVEMTHPAGDFCLFTPTEELEGEHLRQPPLVLLSAGVGQTPLLSMLNTLTQESDTSPYPSETSRRISYIHCTRSSETHAFKSHINFLDAKFQSINSLTFYTQPNQHDIKGQGYDFAGRLNLDLLDQERDLFLDEAGTEYYVCGPGPFMMQVSGWLMKSGVDAGRIKMEVFGAGSVQG